MRTLGWLTMGRLGVLSVAVACAVGCREALPVRFSLPPSEQELAPPPKREVSPTATSPASRPLAKLPRGDAASAEHSPVTRGGVRFYPVGSYPGGPRVEVDGYFNLRQGFLEFLACAPGVKPHETLVALDCDPRQLNAALLMLGVEPGTAPESDYDLRPIAGQRLVLLLRWKTRGEDGVEVIREMRAEDCILNGPAEETMQRVGWVYFGSRFISEEPLGPPLTEKGDALPESQPAREQKPRKVYAPLLTGQLIALCHRPLAILDNPMGLPYVDGDFYAYAQVLPAVRRDEPTEVTMIFRRPREGEIDMKATHMRPPKVARAGDGHGDAVSPPPSSRPHKPQGGDGR